MGSKDSDDGGLGCIMTIWGSWDINRLQEQKELTWIVATTCMG